MMDLFAPTGEYNWEAFGGLMGGAIGALATFVAVLVAYLLGETASARSDAKRRWAQMRTLLCVYDLLQEVLASVEDRISSAQKSLPKLTELTALESVEQALASVPLHEFPNPAALSVHFEFLTAARDLRKLVATARTRGNFEALGVRCEELRLNIRTLLEDAKRQEPFRPPSSLRRLMGG